MSEEELSQNGNPWEILGVSTEADDEEIRAAYLRKVRQFPPDRAAEQFEQIRDAYAALRDPRRRCQQMILSADPAADLISLLKGEDHHRRFVGLVPWLNVIRNG